MSTPAESLLQPGQVADDQQLLKLFWNRAELKKELARLRRDNDRLLDQLRHQENVNLRIRQRLEQLEGVLADPQKAANAAVYYQLRGVWQQSRKRLMRFARELSERQRDREQLQVWQRFEEQQELLLKAIDLRLEEVQHHVGLLQADLAAVRARHARLRGFWNWLRRRRMEDREATIRATLDGLKQQALRIREERHLQMNEGPPPLPKLRLETRRNINLAVLAMAQQLFVHFNAHGVAALAHDASARTLADAWYGDVAHCQELMEHICEVVEQVEAITEMGPRIRRRAELLSRKVHYLRDADVVPDSGCLDDIFLLPDDDADPAEEQALQVNVLIDEYWDLYSALLT